MLIPVLQCNGPSSDMHVIGSHSVRYLHAAPDSSNVEDDKYIPTSWKSID